MKKSHKIAFALASGAATAALLAGCSMTIDETAPATVDRTSLSYNQDTRTGLCFAEVKSDDRGPSKVTSITNVDCSDIVTRMLPDAPDASQKLAYSFDKVTENCFAALTSRTSGPSHILSIAAVPCTPKVKALVQ